MSGKGWEAHTKVREGSRGPPQGPEGFGVLPGGPRGVGRHTWKSERPTRRFSRGRQADTEVQEE